MRSLHGLADVDDDFVNINLNLSWPNSMYTSAPLLARKVLPKMIGVSKSTSQSRITKSVGNMNISTLTRMSYRIPISFFTILSSINNHMLVGVRVPKPNFLNTTRGIKLLLAPKLHNAFAKSTSSMVRGIVNAPRSSFFYTKDFVTITL